MFIFINTLGYPFYDDQVSTLLNNILTSNVSYEGIASPLLVDFLKKIFVVNPKNRISIQEIKEHSWFKM